MHADTRAIPNRAEQASDETRHLPKTLYVDFARLEACMSREAVHQLNVPAAARSRKRAKRVTTVNHEVADLRRNVKDAAKAVLQWLASVTQHDGRADLDRVLDQCLRPGSDTTAVNYTALAQHVNQTLGTDFSPKRIQTAVRHLRQAVAQDSADATPATDHQALSQRFDQLIDSLHENHAALLRQGDGGGHVLRRAVAHDVLSVLRHAAGRLIECGFGQGIPQEVDLDATRERFLAFVRHTPAGSDQSLRTDIDRLLKALENHDGSNEADTQLVIAGVCVVADLVGPDSLFGILARLNLVMVARPMIESDLFIQRMTRLADAAGRLIHDRATQTDMAWVRLLPEDRHTPGPNRLRSYCLNNAATHILQRLHTGELQGNHYFAAAQDCYATMHRSDRGFKLLKVTEAIMLSVLADLTGNATPADEMFRKLGRAGTLQLLTDLARYDNSPALNQLVRDRANAVHDRIAADVLVLPA